MRGSWNPGSTSWPNAVTSVRNSTPNETIVNQCATATTGRRDIRVCPRNSRTSVTVRAPGRSVRFVGCPSRNVATKRFTVWVNRAMALSVTATHTTSATICRTLMPREHTGG